MKTLFVLCFWMLPIFLLAQEQSVKKNSIHLTTGVAIGSGVSTYYGINRQVNQPSTIGVPRNEDFPEKVLTTANYRLDIAYQRMVLRQFYLKTGVGFAHWNLKTASYTNKISDHNSWYLEIPFEVRYDFNQKQWTPYVEGGLATIFRLTYSDHATAALVAQAALGLACQISKQVSIYGQVSARAQFIGGATFIEYERYLNSLEVGKIIYPYDVGIELGAAFHF